jgi:Ca-activated chloride channel homolog
MDRAFAIRRVAATGAITALVIALSACSSGAPSTAPSSAPSASVGPSAAPSSPASPTARPTGAATVSAAETVAAGASFEVEWTGPAAMGDYVTIVPDGTAAWTDQPYFNTTSGSPGTLTAPVEPGEYEIWYVNGLDNVPSARRPIIVSAFAGTLDGPAEVTAGTEFDVSWTGPNGPGDYVTIVAAGTESWSSESYFQTSIGPTGKLVAPLEAGDYELWYVPGSERTPAVRAPITVLATTATLDAPDTVAVGAQFQVAWTGPNGPGDYITIVRDGAPAGEYLSYDYTATGPTVTLTAPAEPGAYELRYIVERAGATLVSRPIAVE